MDEPQLVPFIGNERCWVILLEFSSSASDAATAFLAPSRSHHPASDRPTRSHDEKPSHAGT